MEQKKIRLLRPDEIECRIGTISEKGLSPVSYTHLLERTHYSSHLLDRQEVLSHKLNIYSPVSYTHLG